MFLRMCMFYYFITNYFLYLFAERSPSRHKPVIRFLSEACEDKLGNESSNVSPLPVHRTAGILLLKMKGTLLHLLSFPSPLLSLLLQPHSSCRSTETDCCSLYTQTLSLFFFQDEGFLKRLRRYLI